MRILVTGATGFVGSRLLERLAEIGGHDLYSMQRYVTGRYVLGADHRRESRFLRLARPVRREMRDSRSAARSGVPSGMRSAPCRTATTIPTRCWTRI